MKAIGRRLLDAASDDGVTGVADLRRLGLKETTHVIRWNDAVGSGIVEIETADRPDYTGQWAPLETVIFSGTAPKQDAVRIVGTYGAIRHRINGTLGEGTVTTKIEGSA